MRNLLFIFILLFFTTGFAFSQNYFQQEVNYIIEVELNDSTHALRGTVKIEYINNSPDTLYSIYFHLYPNAYKNNKTAFARQQVDLRSTEFRNSDNQSRGYIDSLNFEVNRLPAVTQITEYEDVELLILNSPLKPLDTAFICTPFYVKIPDSFSRFGHVDNAYQITQWYPKPAVYDKYGWHHMPYLDMGEFYSEFGSFDVTIILPQNYVVAATGNLVTKTELEWLEDLSEKDEWSGNFKSVQRDHSKTKRIRYLESNVHDFAWFADQKFIVRSDTVILPESGRKVHCWTFATPANNSIWEESVEYVKESVRYYSECLGDYPYNNCSAVDGALSAGGGMEYPGVTVVSDGGNKMSLERVIFHEVGHNWFYGILASNERQFPWIDEGFNSFYENRFFSAKYPATSLAESYLGKNVKLLGLQDIPQNYELKLMYLYLASFGLSQPCGIESTGFSPVNYWVMSYQKPVIILQHLEAYLTTSVFDEMMHYFYNQWKFKHPYPEDIRQSFYESTGDSLTWFFEDLVNSDKKLDYGIKKVNNDSVFIVNKSNLEAPVFFSVDDVLYVSNGFAGVKSFKIPSDFSEIEIDDKINTIDFKTSNNYYNNHRIFHKTEPIKLHFAGVFDIPSSTELNIFPALAVNRAQKLMLGAIFYNSGIVQKGFEWIVIPLFAPFRANNIQTALGGFASAKVNIVPENKRIRQLSIYQKFKKYSFDVIINNAAKVNSWFSSQTGIVIYFAKNPQNPYLESKMELSSNYSGIVDDKMLLYSNLLFKREDLKIINPYSFLVNLEYGPGYMKSWIEVDYTLSYLKKNRGLTFHIFAGKFLYNSDEYYGNFNFRLAGNLGLQDYQYNQVYYSRGSDLRVNPSEFWSHQFERSQGGFVSYTPLGQTKNWLVAANITSSTPLPIIKVFCNAGTWAEIGSTDASGVFAWEVGIQLELIRDVFSVFFPLLVSKDIKSTNAIYFNNYFERIRFTLNLNLLNPFDYRHKISYLI